MWYVYVEFCSATKNEILSFLGKWMEVENVILSERLRWSKASCPLLYVKYRPNTNTENYEKLVIVRGAHQ
jgi:hypothetical protein